MWNMKKKEKNISLKGHAYRWTGSVCARLWEELATPSCWYLFNFVLSLMA